jgi:hypothetical protein
MRAIRLAVENGVLSLHILQKYKILTPIMNITQVAHLTLSLLINISATSIIALKAWCVHIGRIFGKDFADFSLVDNITIYRKYRKSLRESGIGVRTPTQGIKILVLLVESGMIYILIGVSYSLVYKHGSSQFFFLPRSRAWSLLLLAYASETQGFQAYSYDWAYSS